MSEQREVKVLQAGRMIAAEEHSEGNVVIAFEAIGDQAALGFLLSDALADELAGALIERPRSKHHHHASSPSKDQPFLVRNVEVLPPEGELFEFRMVSEEGPAVTFRLGSRQVERLRNMLTAQIARQEKRSRQ
ncbi:hypothetical protein ACETRX_22955 [Labrys portucalensis]|uniref:Uncharacterized protein n=1 Tax=Labrys neptuniae TaxID=376174 RepID=A0ABV6ZK61_9HYPH